MPLETFAERVRLGARDRFVLWQSAFEFDVPSPVLRDERGRIPVFTSPEEARAYATTHGLVLGSYPPGVDPTIDLDVVAAWAAHPNSVNLDCEAIVDVWRFLHHAELLPGMYDDDLDPALERVAWQLDAEGLPRIDRQRFGHLAPAWTAEELELLARTLLGAVEAFRGLLTSQDAV